MPSSAERQIPEESAAESGRSPRVRGGLVLALGMLLVLLVPVLAHKSQFPWLLNRYSKSYALMIFLHALAIGAAAVAVRRARGHGGEMMAVLRGFGFLFWAAAWAGLLGLCTAVYGVSADAEFLHLAGLLFFAGMAAGVLTLAIGAPMRPFLSRAALMGAAAALALVFCELALAFLPVLPAPVRAFRALQQQYCDVKRTQRFLESVGEIDPELGYKFRPNLDRIAPGIGEWTEAYPFRTDAWGFFNPRFDPQTPADVVIVGDSFVDGVWPRIVERQTGLRVVNHGLPGYSPPQYTIVLQRRSLALRPRLALYCIYLNDADEASTFEDWKNSGRDWAAFKGGLWFGPASPHYGRTVVKRALVRFSSLFTLLEYLRAARDKSATPLQAQPIRWNNGSFELIFDRASYAYFANVAVPAVSRGLKIIERSVAEARRSCEEAHARLVVLLLPPKELVYFEPLRRTAPQEDPVGNLAKLYGALQALCVRQGVECHDLTERFREEAAESEKPLYRPTDIHWNPYGSGVMAKIVAELLAKGAPADSRPSPPTILK